MCEETCVLSEGGAKRTGAAPSLPMGRKGSRFAWTKVALWAWRGEETVMFGTRGVLREEAEAAMRAERDALSASVA